MNHHFLTFIFRSWILSCLLFSEVSGQEYQPAITNITVNNGLSQSTILDMVHDLNGFLWIATQDGLNKYDGYTFKVFKSSPDNIASLSNNFTKCLEIDKEGNIWIGTQAGLTIYDIKKETFRRQLLNSEKAFGSNTINDIAFTNEKIWLATEAGLLVSPNDGNFNFELFKPKGSHDLLFHIEQLAINEANDLFVATENGLFLVNDDYTTQLVDIPGADPNINCLFSIDNQIWLGTGDGLWSFKEYDINNQNVVKPSQLINYTLPNTRSTVISLHKDHSGNIWVGTESNGLLQVDEGNANLKLYMPLKGLFRDTPVNQIFEDFSNDVWVGTVETGLFKIIGSTKNFGLLRTETNESGLSSNIVRGLLKIGNDVWLGTSRGLNVYNKKSMDFAFYEYDIKNPKSISSNDVKIIEMSKDGYLWVGTDDGLNRFNVENETFERFFAEDDNALVNSNRIRSINLFSDGHLWIGSLGGGITVVDPIRKELIKAYYSDNAGKNKVMDIFEDSNGTKWAASYGAGLCRLNPVSDVFEEVLPKEQLPKLLSSIHEDDNGSLWIGTYGDGLINLNPKDLSYRIYTTKDGLSNDVVYAAIPYDKDLWISTNYGLNRFDQENMTFSNYNENDGLQSNEFNTASYYKCVSGELFFGGVNGLTFFYPDSIQSSSEIPKLAFTDFRIFNESIKPDEIIIDGKPPLKEGIKDAAEINLAHFHNSFTIEFSSLDYSNPIDSKYAYQLEGFDKDWIYTDAFRRDVTYTNLAPNSYTFKMKATNGDGYWNEEPIKLYINVAPSIWQTGWFRTLLVLIGASFIALVVNKRINKVERRRRFLEGKIKEHTKEISDQNELLKKSEKVLLSENKKKDQVFYILAHNVRAPLTTFVAFLRNIDTLPANQIKSFATDLNKQVSESLLLLDNSFYWSLIQFGKLQSNKEQLNLNSIIKETALKFERSALTKGIQLKHEKSSHTQVYSDKQMLSIIVQNLFSNAIKYSPDGGQVNISVENRGHFLELIVEDYGIGMKEEDLQSLFSIDRSFNKLGSRKEKGTGLGLIISTKLADHLGCKLKVDSQEGMFTKFCLEIPVEIAS